jgi:hypothetical protein
VTSTHADLAMLLAYWMGELDEPREAAFEEHYLGCQTCSGHLAEVEALAVGVRAAFAGGRVGTFVTPAFVERLRSGSVRLREYIVPCNGSVNCSVAPEDQFLLSHLQVSLEGVERVDAIVVHEGEHRFEDVPFDPASGAVVLAPSIELVRTLAEHRQAVRLVAVSPAGERLLGEYVFNHSPHR